MFLRTHIRPLFSYILVAMVAAGSAVAIVKYMDDALVPSILGIDILEETEDLSDEIPEIDGTVEVTETPGNWVLISGDMKDTCTAPAFSGEAKIKGWLVYREVLGTKEWMFQIAKADQSKLPMFELISGGVTKTDTNQFAYLDAIPEDIVSRIRTATPDSPTTITVKGYRLYCEGSPLLSFEEIPVVTEGEGETEG
jgi:hypothetical protein